LVQFAFEARRARTGGDVDGRLGVRGAHDEYQTYYYAQAVYVLGDDRYGQMFPKDAKDSWLTWSKYRESIFEYLKGNQMADGSWNGGYVGPVFGTCVALTILQERIQKEKGKRKKA
jgi:hypothetical protein